MAASVRAAARLAARLSLPLLRSLPRCPLPPVRPRGPPRHGFSTAARLQSEKGAAKDPPRYQDRPWDYLQSEEYIERYGTGPVWTSYRRNHKGSIPRQKTRKTCIRGEKLSGNPCPICRDPNLIVHHQNVGLLEQFVSPHTGAVHEPSHTGVCVKQQKRLQEAISTARNNGLLRFHIAHVDFLGEDYSNCHDAVGATPRPQTLPGAWYKWYSEVTPDEHQVARVKKTYRAYLK
ncbi:small ribosomal subunit protein mS40 [Brachionichthys hirsutus]|uniref:small ribosomal subunit protein mS40 n=1 Tax=Brachionichthys hirsutus TaxID=412623 RepID=UPI0036045877